MNNKIINLIHMARKAGKVEFGYDACSRAAMHHKCKLIICSEDLAENQCRKLKTLAEASNVKFLRFGSKKEFGEAFSRRDVAIIAIEDRNFANGILLSAK